MGKFSEQREEKNSAAESREAAVGADEKSAACNKKAAVGADGKSAACNKKAAAVVDKKSAARGPVLRGIKDGLPIGVGYFAVGFSLGIVAGNAGITALQGFVMSALNNASAGEYAGIAAIGSNATYIEIAFLMLITNARYLLMSCALSQRLDPALSLRHRMLIGFDITDELFGISITRPSPLDPRYLYGAYMVAIPCWASGTALGIVAGNLLSPSVVQALSAAIFGMFLAVIVPPCKHNKVIAGVVLVSFAASIGFSYLPLAAKLSESLRIIILTLIISAAAAVLFPIKDEEEKEQ